MNCTTKPYKIKTERGSTYVEYKPKELPPLYMFLPVNIHTIEHFSTETLWGSVPSVFNDPFDSLGIVKEQELKALLEKEYEKNPDLFDPTIPIETNIKEIIANTIKRFEAVRDNFVVSCFSPNITNAIMWGHYGRSGKGFALEYSAEDLLKCADLYFEKFKNQNVKKMSFLSPVLYYDEPINLTPVAIDLAKGLFETIRAKNEGRDYEYYLKDEFLFFNTILTHKNCCWEYEEEYRLCVQNFGLFLRGENKKYIEIGHCKPTAIYLGANIAKDEEEILIRIARDKSIPVYKMTAKILNDKYCLMGELKAIN